MLCCLYLANLNFEYGFHIVKLQISWFTAPQPQPRTLHLLMQGVYPDRRPLTLTWRCSVASPHRPTMIGGTAGSPCPCRAQVALFWSHSEVRTGCHRMVLTPLAALMGGVEHRVRLSLTLGSWIQTQLCHLATTWPWISYLTPRGSSFLICQTEVGTVLILQGWGCPQD